MEENDVGRVDSDAPIEEINVGRDALGAPVEEIEPDGISDEITEDESVIVPLDESENSKVSWWKSPVFARVAFIVVGVLTLVNILLYMLYIEGFYFPTGLMLQQFVDKGATALFLNGTGIFIFTVALAVNVLLGLAFIALGVFTAHKRRVLALVGEAVYAVDTVIIVFMLIYGMGSWVYNSIDLTLHIILLACIVLGLLPFFSKKEKRVADEDSHDREIIIDPVDNEEIDISEGDGEEATDKTEQDAD